MNLTRRDMLKASALGAGAMATVFKAKPARNVVKIRPLKAIKELV